MKTIVTAQVETDKDKVITGSGVSPNEGAVAQPPDGRAGAESEGAMR
jgi:hypothetical protein